MGEVEVVAEVTEEVKFGDVTTADGITLYFPGDELTEGSKLYLDEGQEESAPAGSHVLENGDIIETDDEGFVISIESAGGEPSDETEEDLEETPEIETQGVVEEVLLALEPIFAEIQSQLDALKGDNADLSKVNEDLKTELSAANDKAEKLSKLPAAEKFTAATKNTTQHLSGHASVRARLLGK